tara:strand:+ start:299 stop:907 length:609 start_codon:yes stop_codon:yes gene_type:complete
MQQNNQRVDEIIKFWFGRVEETIVPSENRARIWFSEDPEVADIIKADFQEDISRAQEGEYDSWQESARGQLALILLLDQFPRHVYRETPRAFDSDDVALKVCMQGLDKEQDHNLSLIERVFFYFPLLHAENLDYQERSLENYRVLSELAFSETRVIFDSFLKFANHHYSIIQRFGRFPQRNQALGRGSSPVELAYLAEIDAL